MKMSHEPSIIPQLTIASLLCKWQNWSSNPVLLTLETLKTHDFTAHPAPLRDRGAGKSSTWAGRPHALLPGGREGVHLAPGKRGHLTRPAPYLRGASFRRGKCHRKDAGSKFLKTWFSLQERKMSINPVSLHGDREKWHSSGEVRKDRGGHLFGDSYSISFC